ncbi:MAG: YraN family protein [Alphaproteobacteria bacterium]|nr:MAG: YraN family protein [Alphaproteobacteria bacterium]
MKAARAERGRAGERAGRRAEWFAEWLYRLAGWRCRARRWRSPAGEIDLVFERRHTLLFVEVKRRTRASAAWTGGEILSHRQRRRLARAIALYRARHPDLAGHAVRVDLIVIGASMLPKRLESIMLME